jgi:hypothetical protein
MFGGVDPKCLQKLFSMRGIFSSSPKLKRADELSLEDNGFGIHSRSKSCIKEQARQVQA